MHQHGAVRARPLRTPVPTSLHHLQLWDLVPGRARATRFRPARQRPPRMPRAVSGAILIRFATAEDCPLLLRLIRELAVYERAPGAVVANEEDLRRHGFGPEAQFE